MNSAFVGYEELTLLDLLNSSYPTQPHSLTANYLYTIKKYSRADVIVFKLKILSKSLKQSITLFTIKFKA